jgi:hypothetical protein
VIWIFACDFGRFFVCKVLDSLVGLQVDFHVDEGAILLCISKESVTWGKKLTGLVNLYVCPLKASVWRSDAGVPLSLNRCMSS